MALRDVIERVRGLPESTIEEAVKFRVIGPVLRELGWNPGDHTRVELEYRVSRGLKKVDFALIAPPGHAVMLIEVKKPSERLGDHIEQFVGYAFREDAKIGALTNGIVWWLYLPRADGHFEDRRFAELRLKEDPLDRLVSDFKLYLGYDELVSGDAERSAEKALETLRNAKRLDEALPRMWNEMLREPPQALIDLVGGRVLYSTGLRADKDRIVRFLRQVHGSPSPAPNEPVKRYRPQPSVPKPSRSPSPSKKPAAYILFGQRHAVRSWKEVWVGVAQHLYERHGAGAFERVVGSPNGRRSYVEIDPNLFGDTQNPERIGDSRFWIATHGSAQALERLNRNLLKLPGHNEDDLSILFD